MRRANGDAFVGFSSTPFFSQCTASGRFRFDASLPNDDGSYRGFETRLDIAPGLAMASTPARSTPTAASWHDGPGGQPAPVSSP